MGSCTLALELERADHLLGLDLGVEFLAAQQAQGNGFLALLACVEGRSVRKSFLDPLHLLGEPDSLLNIRIKSMHGLCGELAKLIGYMCRKTIYW